MIHLDLTLYPVLFCRLVRISRPSMFQLLPKIRRITSRTFVLLRFVLSKGRCKFQSGGESQRPTSHRLTNADSRRFMPVNTHTPSETHTHTTHLYAHAYAPHAQEPSRTRTHTLHTQDTAHPLPPSPQHEGQEKSAHCEDSVGLIRKVTQPLESDCAKPLADRRNGYLDVKGVAKA